MKEVPTKRGKVKNPTPNIIDRAVSFFDPVRGVRRLRARATMALAGGYIGGSKSRRGLKMWTTYGHDADSDILPDLPTLRERSRDLIRNNPLATGAIKNESHKCRRYRVEAPIAYRPERTEPGRGQG